MIQRPVSPPSLPATTLLGSSPVSRLRGRVNRRKCGGGIAVCCVGVICVMLFMAEMRTTDLAVVSVGSESSGVSQQQQQQQQQSESAESGELEEKGVAKVAASSKSLRRFGSFKQYVEVSRAEGGESRMPVVEQEEADVTIPSLIIIGARRAGTSSLFSMLGQHPDVGSMAPQTGIEGPGGFMTQDPASYPRKAEWPGDGLETELSADVLGDLLSAYARPYTLPETRKEGSQSNELVTGELGPGYLASTLAPYRLKVAMPDVKIVLLVRDPVDRYFSELRAALCVEDEDDVDWEDISTAFAMPAASKDYLSTAVLDFSPYDKRCLGEGASAADLWACQTAAQKSHRPLLEGLYAGQVGRWLRAFGDSQIKVVDSGSLFKEPEKTAAEVAQFAGLEEHKFFEFAVDRESSCEPRRRSSAIASAYSKRKEAEPKMRRWFADHNDMLAELVGKELDWNERIRSMSVNTEDLI